MATAAAAGRMQSVVTVFPTISRPQQRRVMTSATTPNVPSSNKSINFASVNNHRHHHTARRSATSSALYASTPDSKNVSMTASPPELDEQPAETSSDPLEGSVAAAVPPPGRQEWGTKSPRRFHVRSDQWINILSSSLSLPFRFGSGALIKGYKVSLVPVSEFPADRYASFEVAGRKVVETGKPGPKPEKPIEVYEFEGCPFCRKVREIVSILDLDVLYYPTPKNGPNFRPKAIKMGGKSQFPYMVDPNTGVAMYESDNIIKYLVEKYGDGKVPLALSLGPVTTVTAGFAMLGRVGKGSMYTPSRLPEKPLQVWAYESSPFCKLVREKLVELELPHYYYSTPRGSGKRDELFRQTGHFQVPYLEDPNTGGKIFESADIVQYLQQTYAVPD